MAEASGLARLQPEEYAPSKTTTYGTGELIKHAIGLGIKHINLFIGGSATNDGGIGMAAALGCAFASEDGTILRPTGESLSMIHHIDDHGLSKEIDGIEFNVLTDVKNELYGADGAAFVYSRQKGADEAMQKMLNDGLKHLANISNNGFENLAGAGAAGGLGYGALTFLHATIKSGLDFIIETTGFEKKLMIADLIITGEGKLDKQTLEGKVVAGVISLAKKSNVPIILVCGSSELSIGNLCIYQIVHESKGLEDGVSNAARYLEILGERAVRDFIQSSTK